MTRAPLLPAAQFDLASFGELLSEPSRVVMLLALMDGAARPASELAHLAGIAPPTASFHLGRLVTGGLMRVEPRGRHRYYCLASRRVAEAIEAVGLLGAAPRPGPAVLRPTPERQALMQARTCYQHLAGRLGVAWLIALEEARFLRARGGVLALTVRGRDWCASLGVTSARWPGGKHCLDWTERRNHLGGPLGTFLTQQLFELRWLARRGDGRAVRVTAVGRRELGRHFSLPPALLAGRS